MVLPYTLKWVKLSDSADVENVFGQDSERNRSDVADKSRVWKITFDQSWKEAWF